MLLLNGWEEDEINESRRDLVRSKYAETIQLYEYEYMTSYYLDILPSLYLMEWFSFVGSKQDETALRGQIVNSRDLSEYICSCRSGKVQVQLHVQAFAGADVMSSLIKYAFN